MIEPTEIPYLYLEFSDEFGSKTFIKYEAKDYLGLSQAEWIVQNFRQFMLGTGFANETVDNFIPNIE
jgi:hypothetical protein